MAQSNRDVILEYIDNLDDPGLDDFLSGFNYDNITDFHCTECARAHGGSCPDPEDDACSTTVADWLGWLCKEPARLRRALATRRI